jgi:hypothetical protein
MRGLSKVAGSVVIAALFAYISVDWVLDRPGRYIHNGPWKTNLATGSAAAGLHHRSRVALHGLWALASSEVIYYHATTDSSGNRLLHGATYRIEGSDPDTRWWSLTAYIDDHFIPNPGDRYSYSGTTVEREPDGSWAIRASSRPQQRNWLPTGERPGELVLTLRCYNPGPRMSADPARVQLPRIVREVSR